MSKTKRYLFSLLDLLERQISYSYFIDLDEDLRVVIMKGNGQIINHMDGHPSILDIDKELFKDLIEESYPKIKKSYERWLNK